MANIPDFTNKQPMIDPMAIANILQRRSEIEYKQQQDAQNRRDQLLAGIAPAIEAGQHIASTMMDMAAKRNQAKGLTDLTTLMTAPPIAPPAPTASSNAIPEVGTFGVQPSPEQNQGYQQSLQDRQKAMVSAYARANPEDFTKQASKVMFPEDKAVDLEQKEVLFNGTPTIALFDKHNANYYDASTKQVLKGDIKPYSPAQDTELTDKDRQELGGLADAIIEGRASPNALVSARGARKEKLSRIVAEKDPSFDLSLAPQRMAIRKDFTPSGKSGQALTSLNTVIGHLDTLNSAADKLDNAQVTKYNSIQNYVKSNIGKPEVKQFNAAKVMVVSELGKIAQGSGVVTNDERKQFDEQIAASSSPEQVKGVTSTWMDLIKSRTDAIKSNWTQTMSNVKPPVPFINDKTKKILVKNGYNPDTLEKNGPGQSNDKVDAFFQSLLRK
jgi:hypothetical protein